jgi:hypothetical protein
VKTEDDRVMQASSPCKSIQARASPCSLQVRYLHLLKYTQPRRIFFKENMYFSTYIQYTLNLTRKCRPQTMLGPVVVAIQRKQQQQSLLLLLGTETNEEKKKG